MHISQPVRKAVLVILIILSFAPFYYTFSEEMILAFHLSKTMAYVGLLTLWWAYVLGVRRLVGAFITDMAWVMKVHKWFNVFGFLFLLIHPLSLAIGVFDLDILLPSLSSQRELGITMGIIALLLWAVIWFTSAIFKGRMKFRPWKRIHLMTYVIFFFTFYHIQVGFLMRSHKLLEYYNWGLFLLFALLAAWQIAGKFGIFISKYQVIKTSSPSLDTITLLLEYVSGPKVLPKPGQYIYIQTHPGGEDHPFSISDFNPDNGQIEITIKDLGSFSHKLQSIPVGAELIVDGPYGDFLSNIEEHSGDIVFIAGGIGITPFVSVMRNLHRIHYDPVPKLYIFHGSKTIRDISFDREIEQLEQELTDFDIVTVLDHEPEYVGEKGFITPKLIDKYVDDIKDANYFMCGPPIMIKILTNQLISVGVNKDRITSENFSA